MNCRTMRIAAVLTLVAGALGGQAFAQEQVDKPPAGTAPMMDPDDMPGMESGGMGGMGDTDGGMGDMMGMMKMMSAMTEMMETCSKMMQAQLPQEEPPADTGKDG